MLALLLLALAGAGRARAAPTAPTPLSPANGADVRIPFQLSWSTAQDPSGVFAYNWQVSATSTFAKILRADSTMGELQDTVSGLAVGTYFWRVQGVSNDFVQGAWSATRSFRIIGAEPSLPATPTLNQPRGGNSFHPWESFGMSWSSVPGATKYILEASKDSAFPSSGVVFSWEQETPSTTILITTVDRGSYSARVFAVNADGITSMPSNVISFSIRFDAPIAAPPTLVSPTGGVTASLPITFTWNHVINPQSSGYHLQISRSSSFSTIDADIPFLNGPTYTVINLPGVGNHFWRVRSFQGVIDTAGTAAATAWSATGTFVLPDAPVRVSSFTLSRPAPAAGQEVYVDLQLNRAVPASGGTINMSSSNPSVAPLPASVPVQGSTSWVQFRFWTGQVDTPTSVTMTATIGSQSSTHTFTVSPSSLKGLEGFPVRRTSGTGFGGYVVLNGQAPPGGAVVSLSSSSSLAVPPATVTVPAGVEATGVTIPTSNVDQDTPVTITATWKGVSVQATTTLTPQPKPTSLTLDPTTTSSTSGSWGRVTAEGLTEDATFSLASSHPDIALVPSEVSVPQFGAAGGFIISTRAVSTTTLVTISVSGGGVTLTATLTLEPVPSSPPGSALSTLSLSPPDVNGGSSSTGVVTVNPSAPAGGIVVSLSSSNTAAATVPASVTIPGGGFSASFPVSTTASAATRTSTITGSAGGTTLTATLTVYGPMPSSLSLDPATVTGGAGSTATVTMTQAAPSGGVVLSLSSSDTTVATVPASVTVAAGATTASFAIATTTGTTQRFAHIGATANGTTKALTLTVDPSGAPPPPPPPPPPAPTPSALSLNPASVTGGTSSTGTVTLSAAAPSGGVAVALSSSNTAAATVPASVTVPAGATSANFSISTLTASTTRSSLITATAGGVSQTATLTVNASAATTDTVTISRAEFSGGRLRVEATSSGSGATLKAYVTSTGVLLGTLSGGRLEVNIASNPGSVTVKSSLGGQASRAVSG